MTLVKIDHPRRIDRFIDDFGPPDRAASSDPRRHGHGAVHAREPDRRERARESALAARAFDATA